MFGYDLRIVSFIEERLIGKPDTERVNVIVVLFCQGGNNRRIQATA